MIGKVRDKTKTLFITENLILKKFSVTLQCSVSIYVSFNYLSCFVRIRKQIPERGKANAYKLKLELKYWFVNSIRIAKTAKEGDGIPISKIAH